MNVKNKIWWTFFGIYTLVLFSNGVANAYTCTDQRCVNNSLYQYYSYGTKEDFNAIMPELSPALIIPKKKQEMGMTLADLLKNYKTEYLP